jgi:hypothetical protein
LGLAIALSQFFVLGQTFVEFKIVLQMKTFPFPSAH